jgi:PEP-CTERM motif
MNLMPGNAIGGYANSFSFPDATIGDTRHALLGPNLMLSQVPEPATLGLLLAGMGLVMLRARQSAG